MCVAAADAERGHAAADSGVWLPKTFYLTNMIVLQNENAKRRLLPKDLSLFCIHTLTHTNTHTSVHTCTDLLDPERVRMSMCVSVGVCECAVSLRTYRLHQNNSNAPTLVAVQ